MVERKSTAANNQETRSEPDSQFPNALTKPTNEREGKQYCRDFMLQLRLHPLSLQKPWNLPDIEVIKEKLYLHNINDSSSPSLNKHPEMKNFASLSRSDYCYMKHEYPAVSSYLNKMYPYCVAPHMYNGPYQNPSSKLRTPYHTYCNPLKKHTIASHPCYKDFATDENLWAKRCYSSCEDMWSCYPANSHSNFNLKKNDEAAVPKSRKKLSIIDPVTGKNILESVTKTSCKEQSNIILHAGEIFKSSDESSTEVSRNSYTSDCCNGASDNGSVHVTNENYGNNGSSSENKLLYEEMRDVNTEFSDDKTFENKSKLERTSQEYEVPLSVTSKEESLSYSKESALISESSATEENGQGSTSDTFPTIPPNSEVSYPVEENAYCQILQQKVQEYHQHACKNCASLQTDAMKEGLRQIKEKIYALRQEQQKMVILQSFYQYKKYRLEEIARNLDEKRIEIANWECNLHNKAKELQDKEQRLENKNKILQQHVQELVEQKKMMDAQEKLITREMEMPEVSKETAFSSKQCMFKNCNDIVWEGMNNEAQNNSRNEETNENNFSDFGYYTNSCELAETPLTNAEKCMSEVSVIDELERNIVMMENLHASNEVGDKKEEIKFESVSSLTVQKKSENVAEPIGYSKGRRYLPEHLKYWLNKRDKNSL